MELLAEYFLDASSPEGRSAEEQAALQQQMADGMHLLPQLITGIDVNVRFNSIDGFEVRGAGRSRPSRARGPRRRRGAAGVHSGPH